MNLRLSRLMFFRALRAKHDRAHLQVAHGDQQSAHRLVGNIFGGDRFPHDATRSEDASVVDLLLFLTRHLPAFGQSVQQALGLVTPATIETRAKYP
jgi:hypothetical protein